MHRPLLLLLILAVLVGCKAADQQPVAPQEPNEPPARPTAEEPSPVEPEGSQPEGSQPEGSQPEGSQPTPVEPERAQPSGSGIDGPDRAAIENMTGESIEGAPHLAIVNLPVPVRTALAFERPHGVRLVISSKARDCASALLGDFDPDEVQTTLDLVHPHPLPRDDKVLGVAMTYRGHTPSRTLEVYAWLEAADASVGSRVRGRLSAASGGVAWSQAFDVEGCGSIPDFEDPETGPPDDRILVMVYGTELRVRGATIRLVRGRPALVLTSVPQRCDEEPAGPVQLIIRSEGEAGGVVAVGQLEVDGYRIEQPVVSIGDGPIFEMERVSPLGAETVTYAIPRSTIHDRLGRIVVGGRVFARDCTL